MLIIGSSTYLTLVLSGALLILALSLTFGARGGRENASAYKPIP